MKISESQLEKVQYVKVFKSLFPLNKNDELILDNNLKVYTLVNNEISENVDFKIITDINRNRYILPIYNQEHCNNFLLVGYRLVICKKIEIKAGDYITKTETNGNFCFVFEADKEQ